MPHPSSRSAYLQSPPNARHRLFVALRQNGPEIGVAWESAEVCHLHVMEPYPPLLATLPLASEMDSLETLTAKPFLYVAHTGGCIAAATGHAASASEQPTAEVRAVNQMKPHEREYFRSWKENKQLQVPTMDWNRARGRMPSNGRPLKKALRRAQALNRIYQSDQAQPSHYYFFVEHHTLWIPLVTAVARVIGAERDRGILNPSLSKSDSQVRTMQTIIRTSRQLSASSEESVSKQQVLEQIKYLEGILRGIYQKQSYQRQSLGERKLNQLTNFASTDIYEALFNASDSIG